MGIPTNRKIAMVVQDVAELIKTTSLFRCKIVFVGYEDIWINHAYSSIQPSSQRGCHDRMIT